MADTLPQELRYLLRLDARPPWGEQSPIDDVRETFGYPVTDLGTRTRDYAEEKAFQAMESLYKSPLVEKSRFDEAMLSIVDWLDRTIPRK